MYKFVGMPFDIATPATPELKKLFSSNVRIHNIPSYFHVNAYNHPDIPVMTSANPDEVKGMMWGLVPHFTRSVGEALSTRKKTLNAAAETLFSAELFRNYAPHNRCLIFVNGFFEWRKGEKSKTPYYIYSPNRKPFALGGVYACWEHPDWARPYGCSIITTEADRLMTEINNTKFRMPLVLPQDKWSQWLDTSQRPEQIMELMLPFDSLMAHPISSIISDREMDTNVPEVQQEIILPPDDWF